MIHNILGFEDLKDFKTLFEILDTNKDGKLSYDEIIDGFRNLLEEIYHEKEFSKSLRKIDEEKSGFLEYDKFVRAAINKEGLIRSDRLELTFRLFDKDKNGMVSLEELKTLLSISSKYTEKAWMEIINQIQIIKDMEISLQSFKEYMYCLKNKSQIGDLEKFQF